MRWIQYAKSLAVPPLLLLAACTAPQEVEEAPPEMRDDDEPTKPESERTADPSDSSERDAGGRAGVAFDAGTRSDAGVRPEQHVERDARPSMDPERADSAASKPIDAGNDAGARVGGCSGKRGARRGKSEQTVMVAGVARTFIHYAPEDLDPNTSAPVVIVPHGSLMSGQMMYDITQYANLAEREHFVVMFPDGVDGPGSLAPWSIGAGTCGLGALVEGAGDDQAFITKLIDFAGEDQCIDREHVFMTGFSMGGYLSHQTACLNSAIRAIGPHSAGTHDLSACPAPPRPVIIFHFQGDALISYDCGVNARDEWVRRNGCSASDPELVTVTGGTCEYYRDCPADAQVTFCSFVVPPGGDGELPSGHAWSGGSKAGEGAFAAITTTESATELGWAFFKKYAW